MGFRIELFVDDLEPSLTFYERALGFRVVRREADYASLVLGDAVLGLAPIAKLPAAGEGPGFTRARLAGPRGAGVEIVLEVDDLDTAFDRFDRSRVSRCRAGPRSSLGPTRLPRRRSGWLLPADHQP